VVKVITEYSRLLDDRELEELSSLFDDELDFRFRDGGSFHGRDAVEELVRLARVAVRHRHIVTNVRVWIEDDDRAGARSDWYLVAPGGGKSWMIEDVGTYEDRFARRDGRWRLRSRIIDSAPR
jgi:3-phenylpropionate/cinnamic acid dioxygenase small subunit